MTYAGWTAACLQRAKTIPPLERLLNPPPPPKALEGNELDDRRREHEELLKRMNQNGG